MKLLKRISVLLTAVLATTGISITTVTKVDASPHQQMNTDCQKDPLFLEHGTLQHWTQGGSHWSHGSHSSHSSHVSHQSGY